MSRTPLRTSPSHSDNRSAAPAEASRRPSVPRCEPLIYGLWAPGALLAADGAIVVTNEAWERLAERPGGRKLKLGGNYFEFNREEAAKGNADGLAILSALTELRDGRPLYREVDLQGEGRLQGGRFQGQSDEPGVRRRTLHLRQLVWRDGAG